MVKKIDKFKIFLEKHEGFFLPAALLFGFILDFITLNRADQIYDNLVLFGYVLLTGLTIFLRYSRPNFITLRSVFVRNKEFIPYLMQFAFGGLFSALVVFYSKSGTFITSFPFLVILIGILIGNEFFLKKYQQLNLQVILFYIALISYATFLTPILLKGIGTGIFLLGAIISLVIMFFFVRFLVKHLPQGLKKQQKTLYKSVFITFLIFLAMYFSNVIPPIPLALKDGGIYYNITKISEDVYVAEREVKEWYKPLSSYNKNMASGRQIYAFSAVFAPTKLTGTIYHQWSYFDEKKTRWIETDRIPINITGGRGEGFRGYSSKSSLSLGLWRVDVETKTGQVIGRLKFNVEKKSIGKTIKERF